MDHDHHVTIRLSSCLFALRLAGLNQPDSFAIKKALQQCIEAATILLADHCQRICSFDGIGITSADHTFGAHDIQHVVDQPSLVQLDRHLDPCGILVAAETHVAEDNFCVERSATSAAQAVIPRADEERRTVAP